MGTHMSGHVLQGDILHLLPQLWVLDGWVSRTAPLAVRFTEGFEAKYGYEPDDNEVLPGADSPETSRLEASGVPGDLVTLNRHVARVDLPDLENGYFIHPAEHTARGLDGDQPTRIEGPHADGIVVFGSDGGGALFALSTSDGSTVYRLPTARIEGAVYEEGPLGREVVSWSVQDFLVHLQRELESAI
ncbi:hypothetical protein QMK19_11255 [Streptomyces sp. H10-C2]|uniref:hypothetical protein n=1 Tax=unclassified Streptomyces TaxID=2593676 RepID=UPI0024B9643B|nr:MULTISPECIES: hypothetical protein [unclassified Streptomyces]MDJ0340587.1 hypothetical protein [Streptomyces sp. PH10-H1]MDJ0370235.1 hypothetical protein [Streptomyces sp. H10-C2]